MYALCRKETQTRMQYLFVIFFLVGLDGCLRNTYNKCEIHVRSIPEQLTVQITLSTLCDATTSLLLILLQDTNLLKCLHYLTVNTSGGIDVVGWARTTVSGGAVNLS